MRFRRPTQPDIKTGSGGYTCSGKEMEVVSEVEKRSSIVARTGKKILSGAIVPPDTTQEEVDRMLSFDGQRYTARVFPTHYPAQPGLFYAGFEIFVLPAADGPLARQ